MPLKLTTYYRGAEIPDLPGKDTFHSKELFQIYEATLGYTPLLLVASYNDRPIAKLLAVIRKPQNHFAITLFKECLVYGNGDYFNLPEDLDKESIFGNLLEHLTQEALRNCSLIEFRNIEGTLFGYKYFRSNHYFAINWLRVRNSLHDIHTPEERFNASRMRQIKKGLKNGAIVSEATTIEEIHSFSRMLHRVYSTRIRRYFPDKEFFRHMDSILIKGKQGKIFIVKYKDKIIGGAVCIYSGSSAYLWFSGGMRKTYAPQYPGVLAIWKAFDEAYSHGFRHLEFMDVGLPFRKHGYRDFVLRFGGKQSSTRRWFRFKWTWINRIMIKLYM